MLTAIDKVLFLMRNGLTQEATTDALSRLAAAARDVELERGERLFQAGDQPQSLWIVLDGAIRVELEGTAPRVAGAGDWVGALPLLAGAPHRGRAVVLVSTRALRLERDDLHELLDEDGELARALLAGLLRSLTEMDPLLGEAS
jgi:CRP-like cAMP-binding protein